MFAKNISIRNTIEPQKLTQALETQTDYEAEYRVIWRDGSICWIFSKGRGVYDELGQPVRMVGVIFDISDRKQAERKIREQAALLDIASDAIFVRDLEHRVLYWNRGAERLYGWTAAEAIGQPAHGLLKSDPTQVAEMVQILLERGEWQGEIRKVAKTGAEVIADARWTLVRDEAGQPKFILSVDTDITEKKHLEAQFYRAQRLESLGTLAGGIAHDLNNVLTPILTIAQLLRLKLSNLDGRSQEILEVLESSAKRGATMIRQILAFTRGTGGERVPVQIALLLQEVVTVIRQTFPKLIAIRELIPEPCPWMVSADPTHLHQILMNLCINARDAMLEGGVLTLSIAQAVVDPAFAQRNLDARVGTYVVVTIADTGTGIPPEVRDRIFDPFFTTKAPGQGTGLGLSTVLGIVKTYGGFVQVWSQAGQGSQFKVYLPLIEGNTGETEQIATPLQGNNELILIVDDDPAVQRTTQSLLQDQHYTTLIANDGREAIALYSQHQEQIKAVLMDMTMPNIDGVAAVRILHQMNPAVKIIAISGLPTYREAVLAAGAQVFLAKPYSIDDLLKHVSDLMQ